MDENKLNRWEQLILILLAMVGIIAILNYISPCTAKNHCDSSISYDEAGMQW